ncbi:hypothetical protein RJ639_043115 [Escallonia herrerae]|uniref:Uncharacterized protein n=1 Tax=Escallonia herrerae TaxID=1293975 RepID=A0AA89B0W4_9ASTE|nr:hypothetical protein RJ639_043115 [Escallonia herrerae]
MAASVESPSPASLHKGSMEFTGASPVLSPSSDRRFWSALRTRIDTLLENRKPIDQSSPSQLNGGEVDRAKRMKEDSLLLLRGFDSVSSTLSQLSDNIANALQGARELGGPPTLSEIVNSTLEKDKSKEKESEEESEEGHRGIKRKFDSQECSDEEKEESQEANGQKELAKLKKAKNLAMSMAKQAASLARELKSIKSDLCFTQERCALLEEENRRLRDGFAKEMRPEEDDLVRLQLEALLAEKSRLANENANLTRENQCLHQLVEYHQLTSQDLSESYEHVIRGMCLDFSSPPPPIPEEEREDVDGIEVPKTQHVYGLPTSPDGRSNVKLQMEKC